MSIITSSSSIAIFFRFEANDHFVGIDFGFTNCSIGYMDGDRFHIVENQQGQSKTPSCVAFSREGRHVGSPAVNCLTVDPENTISGKIEALMNKL